MATSLFSQYFARICVTYNKYANSNITFSHDLFFTDSSFSISPRDIVFVFDKHLLQTPDLIVSEIQDRLEPQLSKFPVTQSQSIIVDSRELNRFV